MFVVFPLQMFFLVVIISVNPANPLIFNSDSENSNDETVLYNEFSQYLECKIENVFSDLESIIHNFNRGNFDHLEEVVLSNIAKIEI